MSTQAELNRRLTEKFSPEFIQVDDESHGHSRGEESHFKAIIVSEIFNGQSRIVRHRAVMSEVKDLMQNPIHALSVHVFTPAEWQARGASAPTSPKCQGGNK